MSSVRLEGRGPFATCGDEFPAALSDAAEAVRRAVADPVSSPALADLVPGAGRVSVLVSDITRGPWVGTVVRSVLELLEEVGAGPERVEIVVATGTHRVQSRQELERHLGADIVERWRTIEHDADDDAAMAEVGVTAAGTVCRFRASVVESALVVAVGGVAFHYFAGYGGARKLVLPGVAGRSTILANHRLSLMKDPGEGLAKGCRPGFLDDNPVHLDMLEGARLLPAPVFAVNAVADGRGRAVFVNAGDLDRSHRAAGRFLDEGFLIRLDRPRRAVIASAGGWPKDINLLQAHKAIRNASGAIDEGGVLLFAAACDEGIGSPSYESAFAGGPAGVPDAVRSGYTLNAQTAVSTRELTNRFSVYLRSGLPERDVTRFGMVPWRNGFAAVLLDGIPDEDILVLRNAAAFLPVVHEHRDGGGER